MENKSNKNRGMRLEYIINNTIDFYKEYLIGIFHKKELTVKFSSVNKINGKLALNNAYIKNKSTVDYYGVMNGRFIAFEAKTTIEDYMPMKNIKDHQRKYLKLIDKMGGKGFYIIYYDKHEEYYLIDIKDMSKINSNRLLIKEAREIGHKLKLTYPGILDFAEIIK